VKKNGRSHYGYKNHVNADGKHKIIRIYTVTDASVHDSQVFNPLLDSSNTGKQVFADSAYRSNKINGTLKERGLKNEIHYKGYRGIPLTEAKQRVNHKRSKIRATAEHIFGFQQNSLGGNLYERLVS
jgi:transposase, IS5 family